MVVPRVGRSVEDLDMTLVVQTEARSAVSSVALKDMRSVVHSGDR